MRWGMPLRIRVRYLGVLRDYLGVFEDVLEFDDGDYSIKDVLEAIRDIRPKYRRIESMLPMVWVYLNGKQVLPLSKVKVSDGDEVALMPTLHEGG
ncbi:MAG: hypothetical protein DRZ82_10070 [Thermoprotei archaeon]|nr:MAG: hypothetical protein DRZ82_10070 [Thermoprotei archaeon]